MPDTHPSRPLLRRLGRQVVVFSNWGFEANNTTERVAKALARAGVMTRYSARPQVPWKHPLPRFWAEPGLECIQPRFLGHRFFRYPLVRDVQSRWIVRQLGKGLLGLRSRPIAVFHDPWKFGHEHVVRRLREDGWRLVQLHLDHGDHFEASSAADLVLSISDHETQALRKAIRPRVLSLPQLFDEDSLRLASRHRDEVARLLGGIPRPRLVYCGAPLARLDADLVCSILAAEPSWSFVTFGEPPVGPRPPNWHVLPWQTPARLAAVVEQSDVGFLPYRVADPVQFHCVPLKLWDCFAADRPVVMTPIAVSSRFGDLVRVGASRDELRAAIRGALGEAADPARTARRLALARAHSLGELQGWLADCILGSREEEPPPRP